jgi:hypothetical protein
MEEEDEEGTAVARSVFPAPPRKDPRTEFGALVMPLLLPGTSSPGGAEVMGATGGGSLRLIDCLINS